MICNAMSNAMSNASSNVMRNAMRNVIRNVIRDVRNEGGGISFFWKFQHFGKFRKFGLCSDRNKDFSIRFKFNF